MPLYHCFDHSAHPMSPLSFLQQARSQVSCAFQLYFLSIYQSFISPGSSFFKVLIECAMKCLQRPLFSSFTQPKATVLSPVRYPNWFNSMFEFCSKLIQFNIRFKIISWKFNSKDYSIFNNFCDSIQYIIQFKMSHLDSIQ